MKKLHYILILFLILESCSNQNERKVDYLLSNLKDTLSFNHDTEKKEKNESTKVDSECSVNLDDLLSINSIWFDYYLSEINEFSVDKFKLVKKWRESQLIQNNILGDFDNDFNINHTKFIINSPDKTHYIDLDSYQIDIIKNENGELICKGGEVDQEIDWVNRKTKEIKRIGFYGSSAWIDDAKWVDNTKVVLFGLNDSHLMINIIDLSTLDFFLFEYPDRLLDRKNYTQEVRLKEVKFE